jgi:membrane-bound acyltransferase YfiQ involved in biofilm formation
MLTFLKKYYEAAVSALFLVVALLFQHAASFDGSQYAAIASYAISRLAALFG